MNAQVDAGPNDQQPVELTLPPLEVGPISHALGQLRYQLSAGRRAKVLQSGFTKISPRVQERSYELDTGERVIVTARRRVARPEDIDGVLRTNDEGSLTWDSHKLIDAFVDDANNRGWPTKAAELAASWNDKFSFRAERPNTDGTVDEGHRGLRPPQLGALHSIGAHWSLSQQPATIVMPTGTGKTETMLACLAAYSPGPLLVIVPWDLLRGQTVRKFMSFGLLRSLGVLAEDAANPIMGVITKRPKRVEDLDIFEKCNVVVATASSLTMGEALPFAPEIAHRVGALVVDEAHHVAAANWTDFRAAFKDRSTLQFTATPFRRDRKLIDGDVIYNYPLRTAQRDGYFKHISFEPIYEIDADQADGAIAEAAIAKLRADLAAGHNHILMARCGSITRAEAVFELYRAMAADLNPILVHSETGHSAAQVEALRAGRSRIVVCVNMLGEGFDLPQLKIAALHDMHRSLAILLQFTGRFTRTADASIGDATVIANIADPDVSGALERLYSDDADWNELLSELSSEAAREHSELVEFLRYFGRLGDEEGEATVSHQLLRPTLSTLVYRATEFRPQRFHEAISADRNVVGAWHHRPSSTLFFVTRTEPKLRWTRSQEIRDREWALFILHYDAERKLLYLSSTDHSSLFAELAAVVGGNVALITGDQVFRTLGRINRLIFQNVGLKKHGRRNLSYASYTGGDVATALGLAETGNSVKNNLSGIGWENGQRVAIGCSYKGRVWSREQGSIPEFVRWSERTGAKLLDDTINTKDIIDNVLIPEQVSTLPDKEVLGIEWPVELLRQSEERIVLWSGEAEAEERPLFLWELTFTARDPAGSRVLFDLETEDQAALASFALVIGGANGFGVEQTAGPAVSIRAGTKTSLLTAYLSDYPPLVRFVDLCELDGDMLVRPQNPQEFEIPDERFEPWDWTGVDITKESIWRGGTERRDWELQWKVAQHYVEGGFDVVFDDDSAGEAADLVCLKEESDHIRLALIHCKFSGGSDAGMRVKDVVEVCSQAVRSAKWKWKFRDLIRHLLGREHRLRGAGRPTRFIAGRGASLNHFVKLSRFREVRAEVLIVQPGLSIAALSADQRAVLASALTYLKETIGADLDVICSP